MKKTFQNVGFRRWNLSLLAVSAGLLVFLAPRHDFVPMWVECWAEFEGSLRIMLGYDPQCPGCWARIGGHSIPLALNPYIGPAWLYLYSPSAFAWLSGLSSDPYIYRYTLIAALLVNTWLFYFLLRQIYRGLHRGWIAFGGAAAFATTPTLLLGSLVEHGSVHFSFLFIFLTAFLFLKYVRGGGSVYLVASAFALGSTLLTRIESFVWLVAPFVVYLALARRGAIRARWSETRRKAGVAALSVMAFCLGAGPMIAYNLTCRENNILSFALTRVLPGSLGRGDSVAARLGTRLEQFWATNLLNQWPMWELHWANAVFAALWFLSVAVVVWRWMARRRPHFPLIAVLVILPLSIFTKGSVRNEHLVVLQPAALLVVISGVAFVARFKRRSRTAMVAIAALVLGNVIVVAADWRYWNKLPDTKQTMLNQADPGLLVKHLTEHHATDRIIFADVGMPQYVRYLTNGKLDGEDILEWYDAEKFVGSVNFALLDPGRKRVFVAVSRGRDNLIDDLPRTELLYKTISTAGVPFTVTRLSSPRNKFLYDLLVVEAGAAIAEQKLGTGTLKVSGVTDVHEVVQNESRFAVGSIKGEGLRDRDAVIANGRVYPTTFGNANWVTFSLPLDVTGAAGALSLELIRPSTLERSSALALPLESIGGAVGRAASDAPATLLKIHPASTPAGHGFNQQPAGESALALVTGNAKADTVIVWQGVELAATYGGPELLTCLVPAKLYARPGRYEVFLRDRRGESNRVIFTVGTAP